MTVLYAIQKQDADDTAWTWFNAQAPLPAGAYAVYDDLEDAERIATRLQRTFYGTAFQVVRMEAVGGE